MIAALVTRQDVHVVQDLIQNGGDDLVMVLTILQDALDHSAAVGVDCQILRMQEAQRCRNTSSHRNKHAQQKERKQNLRTVWYTWAPLQNLCPPLSKIGLGPNLKGSPPPPQNQDPGKDSGISGVHRGGGGDLIELRRIGS